MIYSLADIHTVADCDALLAIANKERKQLNLRRQQNDVQYDTINSGSVDVEIALSTVNVEIAATEAIIAGQVEGPTKEITKVKLFKLQHKKLLLDERKERVGTMGLIQKEYALNCVDKELAENQVYIDAVNARKVEL